MTDPGDFWHILPYYVKQDVVHCLDYETRCNLSYCSKSDLALVKSTPIAYRSILWNRVYPHIHFNTLNCPKNRSTKLGTTCVERLCDMLRAPNTCKHLSFHGHHSDEQQEKLIRLIRELKENNIHPKIQSLKMLYAGGDIFYEFLTQLDADYLYGIILNSFKGTKEQVARIFQTEQWRKLHVVLIRMSGSPTWWLESILDKPKFVVHVGWVPADTARRIVKTFQEKNHPVGSCFSVTFYYNCINVLEIYEDPGCRMSTSNDCAYYLKKFPLADEAHELRVQLMLTSVEPDSNMEVFEISGIVARKNTDLEYVNVSDIIKKCLRDD